MGGLNYIHLANINFYVKLEAEADAFFYKRIFPISLLALSSLNKSLPNLKGFYITELLSKYKKSFYVKLIILFLSIMEKFRVLTYNLHFFSEIQTAQSCNFSQMPTFSDLCNISNVYSKTVYTSDGLCYDQNLGELSMNMISRFTICRKFE